MTQAPIVLLTDFGNRDPFVGIMKGVMYSLAPGCQVIDLTNEIPPGDLLQGAVTLWQSASYFPEESIFLVVVDPGVGTSRRGIAARIGSHYFVGPDNGLLSFIWGPGSQCRALEAPEYRLDKAGTTFHGRDIFAPAAAHLWAGARLDTFGQEVREPIQLAAPRWEISEAGELHGQVLFADRFGNVLTSLGTLETTKDGFHARAWLPGQGGEMDIPPGARIRLADGVVLEHARTFAEIPARQCAWILGSSGLVEIAARNARAAEILKLQRGDPVVLQAGQP